jgi:hypothetical protein
VTALIVAAHENNVQIAQALIAAVADVHVRRKGDKCTALDIAAFKGHVQIVQAILDVLPHSSLTNLTDAGWTPIQMAASMGHVEVVQALDKAIAGIGGVAPMTAAAEAVAKTAAARLEEGVGLKGMMKVCWACGKEASKMKRCSGCEDARYSIVARSARAPTGRSARRRAARPRERGTGGGGYTKKKRSRL